MEVLLALVAVKREEEIGKLNLVGNLFDTLLHVQITLAGGMNTRLER